MLKEKEEAKWVIYGLERKIKLKKESLLKVVPGVRRGAQIKREKKAN